MFWTPSKMLFLCAVIILQAKVLVYASAGTRNFRWLSETFVGTDYDPELVTVNRTCVQLSITPVGSSCGNTYPIYHHYDSSPLRVALSSMIHACVQFADDPGVRRLRVLAGTARLYPELQRLGSNFSTASGIPLYFNFSTRVGGSGALIRAAMAKPPPIEDTPDTLGGADAFIVGPSYMPNMKQGGKLLDLSQLVDGDLQLKWFQIKKVMREQMVMYGNKVVAIPLTTAPSFLFYHAPTFRRHGLTVPSTWNEVVELAEQYHGKDLNGDGQPDFGICMTPPNCGVDGVMIQFILASFVQTHGSSHGLFLDPASMANLANTTAMVEVLQLMRRLRLAGPRTGNCAAFEDQPYLEGRCLLSLSSTITFKAAYAPGMPAAYAAMRGNMGMAPFPGSTRVLDRATGRMVPCDATTCPLASTTARDTDGVVRPVNQPAPSNNVVVMINGQSPPKYQFYAYSLFSYLASPEVLGATGAALLLDPRLETSPLRDTDLLPSAQKQWVAAGYQPDDVAAFFAACRAAMDNPNQSFESKFPNGLGITFAASTAASMYANASVAVPPPVSVAVAVVAKSVADLVSGQGGADAFAPVYRQTLNWVPPPPPPPPPSAAAQGGAAGVGSARGANGLSRQAVVVLAVLPCSIAVLLAVALWVVGSRWGWRRRLRAGVALPPGAGPDTTILVTDIQSSTSLWEHLDPGVMNEALSVHHGVMRRAIATWGGYESGTEGDSFIVAFKNPTDALHCALAAQQALLEASWPAGLLLYAPLPGLECDEDPLLPVTALLHGSAKNKQQLTGARPAFPKPVSRSPSGIRALARRVTAGVSGKTAAAAARLRVAAGVNGGGGSSFNSVVPTPGPAPLALLVSLPSMTLHVSGALSSYMATNSPFAAAAEAAEAAAGAATLLPRADGEDEAGADDGDGADENGNGGGGEGLQVTQLASPVSAPAPLPPLQQQQVQGKHHDSSEASDPGQRQPRCNSLQFDCTSCMSDVSMQAGSERAAVAASAEYGNDGGEMVSDLPPAGGGGAIGGGFLQRTTSGTGYRANPWGSSLSAAMEPARPSLASGSGSVAHEPTLAPPTLAASILATVRLLKGRAAANTAAYACTFAAVGDTSQNAAAAAVVAAADGSELSPSSPALSASPSVILSTSDLLPHPASNTQLPPTLPPLSPYLTGGDDAMSSPQSGGASGAAALAAAGVTPLFRGLRVRMGMWTGVPHAADVTVNATSKRTQYSGDAIVWAKAVSDSVHGGMVVLPECSRRRLDPDAVRAARHYLMYGGLHVLSVPAMAAAAAPLHLYLAYGQALLPRAVIVRQLRSERELRPGLLSAPVARGVVVEMRVVGIGTLLAWNRQVVEAALDLLHAAALRILPVNPAGTPSMAATAVPAPHVVVGATSLLPQASPPPRPSPSSGDGAAGTGGAVAAAAATAAQLAGTLVVVFGDADGAVTWAGAMRRAVNAMEWPVELLHHELAEEVWAAAPTNAGFGSRLRREGLVSAGVGAAVKPAAAVRTVSGGNAAAAPAVPTISAAPAALTSGFLGGSRASPGGARSLAGGGNGYVLRRSRFSNGFASPGLSSAALTCGHSARGLLEGDGDGDSGGGAARTSTEVGTLAAAVAGPDVSLVALSPLFPQTTTAVQPRIIAAAAAADSNTSGSDLVCGELPSGASDATEFSSRPSPSATRPRSASRRPMVAASPAVIFNSSRFSFESGGLAALVAKTSTAAAMVPSPPPPRKTNSSAARLASAVRAASAATTATVAASATALVPAARTLLPPPPPPVPPSSLEACENAGGTGYGANEQCDPAASTHLAAAGTSFKTSDVGIAAAAATATIDSAGVPLEPSPTTGAAGKEAGELSMQLLYRGLRLRWGVASGALKGKLLPGDVSGLMSYKGKAFAQAAKLAAKAKAGQICATPELARTLLSAHLAEELTILEKA